MSELKFKKLFEPIRLGRQLFRHRIFSSPQDIYRLTYEGFLDEAGTAFYELKALGGFASVCLGDFFVDSKYGRSHMFQMVGDDIKGRGSLTRTANAIKRHGAVAAVELNHAGKNSSLMLDSEDFIYGIVDEVREDGVEIRAMDDAWIERVIECYAAGASFARQCGYGMITIHAGHGWLPAQFFSRKDNTRKDKWGGSLENRLRFPLAVVDAVRKRVGAAVPIEVRISGAEAYDGGYEIDEGIEFAKALDGKVDLIHISAGHHEYPEASMVTHPPMFSPDGVNVHLAAEIKKHVQTPVATVGALTDPAMMEEIIISGKADVVQLGRQSLADPYLPLKARMGKDDEINQCLRCMSCFSGSTSSGIFYCATNPVIGHERDTLNDSPPRVKKKVLVAGGGVGGMQAALTASERGHHVILCEKTDRLGGTLICEEHIPFKEKLDSYLKRQALRLSRSTVDIHMNTAVTPQLAREIAPDVIIASLGARPVKPPVPGIDGDNVYGAEEVYFSPDKAGERVVILGAGLVGLELGIFLAQSGRKVDIVEMLPTTIMDVAGMKTSDMINHPELLAPGVNIVHGIALAQQIEKLENLNVYTSTAVTEIDGSAVMVKAADGERRIEADTVVYAVGQRPLSDEALALAECAPEYYPIGDCVEPANITAATSLAYQIARDIGDRI
jgi:2,4-dienoyl-CoA reductase-like NADH-dependent reductase (Old Yellow Enzyme family)/thioredoxin reductase